MQDYDEGMLEVWWEDWSFAASMDDDAAMDAALDQVLEVWQDCCDTVAADRTGEREVDTAEKRATLTCMATVNAFFSRALFTITEAGKEVPEAIEKWLHEQEDE